MKRASQRSNFNSWESSRRFVADQFDYLETPENTVYSRTMPIKIESELNSREHWAKKGQRHTMQKYAVRSFLNADNPKITPPCLIKLTRIAPRYFDSDNLVGAFKYVKDAIAEYFHPDLAIGRADDDPNLHWEYVQEKGAPKTYEIRIEITKNPDC